MSTNLIHRLRSTLTALGVVSILAPVVHAAPSRLDPVIDAVVANERELARTLQAYGPLVETYLQTVEPHAVLGTVPVKDSYFFGRLDLAPHPEEEKRGTKRAKGKRSLDLLEEFHSGVFKPEEFARMLLLDRDGLDRDRYSFEFLRAEYLGDVRTLVFDVVPKDERAARRSRTGRFTGRIWVEDRDHHIVRFNGIYASDLAANFHFDSWRMNLEDDLWFPAYVYVEEKDRSVRQRDLTHRGQIRVWGYRPDGRNVEDEFTKVLVEAEHTRDESEGPGFLSPVESARAWQAEAEDNVIRRLERAGLLAPAGKLEQVLKTVVTNLEVTNGLELDPPVRCRVLLTTPLESFTVGRTIVLSRGLIDVLPDEASLAMVLAHEMGHVLSGHELDTRFAFTDRVLVADREAVREYDFSRDPAEEGEADRRAVELLRNSPYREKLAAAGLFLKALEESSPALRSLIRPHFGAGQLYRMTPIVEAAPPLDAADVGQIAALPLGARVHVDPWTARVELMPGSRASLLSAREKMSFQITPLMPRLRRGRISDADVSAARGLGETGTR
jgi:hypothetical protein